MDRRRALGVALVLVAGASFASGSIFATLAYGTGLDWLTLMWWRFLIGGALAWGWVMLSSSLHGLAAAVAMWLAFVPNAWYTRMIRTRAERRLAAQA